MPSLFLSRAASVFLFRLVLSCLASCAVRHDHRPGAPFLASFARSGDSDFEERPAHSSSSCRHYPNRGCPTLRDFRRLGAPRTTAPTNFASVSRRDLVLQRNRGAAVAAERSDSFQVARRTGNYHDRTITKDSVSGRSQIPLPTLRALGDVAGRLARGLRRRQFRDWQTQQQG
jgi:hypothetical protein